MIPHTDTEPVFPSSCENKWTKQKHIRTYKVSASGQLTEQTEPGQVDGAN